MCKILANGTTGVLSLYRNCEDVLCASLRIQVLCLLWNAISRLVVWFTISDMPQLCVLSDILLLLKYSLLTCLYEFPVFAYQIPYWYITTLVYINKAEGPCMQIACTGYFSPVAPGCLIFVNYVLPCKTYVGRGIFVKWKYKTDEKTPIKSH